MSNYYHLIIETLHSNFSKGIMRHLNGVYSQRVVASIQIYTPKHSGYYCKACKQFVILNLPLLLFIASKDGTQIYIPNSGRFFADSCVAETVAQLAMQLFHRLALNINLFIITAQPFTARNIYQQQLLLFWQTLLINADSQQIRQKVDSRII